MNLRSWNYIVVNLKLGNSLTPTFKVFSLPLIAAILLYYLELSAIMKIILQTTIYLIQWTSHILEIRR